MSNLHNSWVEACKNALECNTSIVDNTLVLGEGSSNSGGGRRRSPMWTVDETTTLINIWGQNEMQRRLREMGRNRPIWNDIARELEDNGYFRTWEQCKSRLHNLESRYKKIKDGTVKKQAGEGLCGLTLISWTRYVKLINKLKDGLFLLIY